MRIDLTTNLSNALLELVMLLAPISDLILKSGFIVAFAALACRLFGSFLKPFSRHLLWLNVLGCIMLIPLLPLMSAPAVEHPNYGSTFDVITVSVIPLEVESSSDSVSNVTSSTASDAAAEPVDWKSLMLGGYLLISAVFLLRYFLAAVRIYLIGRRAQLVTDLSLVKRINKIRQQLDIDRTVSVKFSKEVAAPLSYGLINPTVIFPNSAKEWPEKPFSSALLHEFGHVGRMDWLTSLVGYIFCSLCWVNPFVWYVNKKLNVEAESATDMSVLRSGVDGREYAQDLLSITRICKHPENHRLLAQHMLSTNLLKSRVALLLDCIPGKEQNSKSAPAIILLLFAGVLTLLSTGSFFRAAITEVAMPLSALSQFQFSALTSSTPTSLARTAEDVGVLSGLATQFEAPQAIPDLDGSTPSAVENTRLQAATNEIKQRQTSIGKNQILLAAEPVVELDLRTSELELDLDLPIVEYSGGTAVASTVASTEGAEEVVHSLTVTGKSLSIAELSRLELDEEIERVETEYYRVFNTIEEDRSLHVLCGTYRPTDSLITKRYCEPRFIRNNRVDSRSVVALQGQFREEFNELTDALNQALNENSYLRELHVYLSDLKSYI